MPILYKQLAHCKAFRFIFRIMYSRNLLALYLFRQFTQQCYMLLLLLLLLYLMPGVTWPSACDQLQCGYRAAYICSRRIIYIQVCLARLPVQASLNYAWKQSLVLVTPLPHAASDSHGSLSALGLREKPCGLQPLPKRLRASTCCEYLLNS